LQHLRYHAAVKESEHTMDSTALLASIWALGGLDAQALPYADLPGCDPVLPSSFAVGTAAQASIAAAALAACELGHARGLQRQAVSVDMTHAALECVGWFSVNGEMPDIWDPFSGLYACSDGWVRVHANFAHHTPRRLPHNPCWAWSALATVLHGCCLHWLRTSAR